MDFSNGDPCFLFANFKQLLLNINRIFKPSNSESFHFFGVLCYESKNIVDRIGYCKIALLSQKIMIV